MEKHIFNFNGVSDVDFCDSDVDFRSPDIDFGGPDVDFRGSDVDFRGLEKLKLASEIFGRQRVFT